MEKSTEKRILAQRYEDDDEFSLLIRSILALAFVPEEDVADTFFTIEIDIRETYPNVDGIDNVLGLLRG